MQVVNRLCVVGALALVAAPAWAGDFGVSFGGGPITGSTTGVSASASYPISSSNSSSTFTGHGAAWPGSISASSRIDTQWDGGFSGGAAYQTDVFARADAVVTGPPGSVQGTLHLHLIATFGRQGGYADNNAHNANLYATIDARFTGGTAAFVDGNHSSYGSYLLTGLSGETIDVPIDLTADFITGYGFLFQLSLTAAGSTYGSSGTGLTDAVMTLRLEEVNGQVMTLPAGYSFEAPGFDVQGNHYSPNAAVNPAPQARAFALRLAGANPSAGPTRLAFDLPYSGVTRLAIYDLGGRRVRSLVSGSFEAGEHALEWDGRSESGDRVASGLYFARAEFGGRICLQRIARTN